jgi:ATP-dependent Zn protease
MARLIWTLGAMAAEGVFYGENSTGVGGDVGSATALAAMMVGAWAMGPERVEVNGRFPSREDEDAERERLMERFERIGLQIMNRASGGGPFMQNPIGSVLGDSAKRTAVAQLLGQAFVTAYNLIAHNRNAVSRIADILEERREMHGDEVVEVLDSVGLVKPDIDLMDDAAWPKI